MVHFGGKSASPLQIRVAQTNPHTSSRSVVMVEIGQAESGVIADS